MLLLDIYIFIHMPLARGYIAAERSELHPKTSQIMHGQPDTLHLVLPFFFQLSQLPPSFWPGKTCEMPLLMPKQGKPLKLPCKLTMPVRTSGLVRRPWSNRIQLQIWGKVRLSARRALLHVTSLWWGRKITDESASWFPVSVMLAVYFKYFAFTWQPFFFASLAFHPYPPGGKRKERF